MTRKKQIIQAAHEYINSDAVTPENMLLAYGDFINGAKWADAHPRSPWISVEDRLPEITKREWLYMKGTITWLEMNRLSDKQINELFENETKNEYQRQSILFF